MEPPPPDEPRSSLADSLVALARRRGVAVPEDGSIAALLAAIEPRPLIPHPLLLVAGAVMAAAFRHDRSLSAPAAPTHADDADHPPSADCSF